MKRAIPNHEERPKDPNFERVKQYLLKHPVYPVSWIFSLRSVCRQTRAETSDTDSYRDNLFSFEHAVPCIQLLRSISADNRPLITSIMIHNIRSFATHVSVLRCPPLRNLLPNLKRIFVICSVSRRDEDETHVYQNKVYHWMTNYCMVVLNYCNMIDKEAQRDADLELIMVEMHNESLIGEGGLATEFDFWQASTVAGTAQNASQSPLLRLPGELRNKIYDYATCGNIIAVRKKSMLGSGWKVYEAEFHNPGTVICSRAFSGIVPTVPLENVFSLRRTCRQIRAETSPIDLCTTNVFSFENLAVYDELVRLRLTLEERDAIRRIFIHRPAQFGADVFNGAFPQTKLVPLFLAAFPNLEEVLISARSESQDLFPSPGEYLWLLNLDRMYGRISYVPHNRAAMKKGLGLPRMVCDEDLQVDGVIKYYY
ncbi:hypothetical protein K491DRAFT_783991 [Lophiostoma macrostomum CBS 122681]|uniref:Uncharacterized protein n=1 Tax=Lophiostoma macrostomum CBS 122681 TaxID=1314788 RepID=A0A6A6SL12_9PLEO|nr:hypothetical protein K491DRAFT_783991 [Lophiostoma macrostomum CBS 122681]